MENSQEYKDLHEIYNADARNHWTGADKAVRRSMAETRGGEKNGSIIVVGILIIIGLVTLLVT